MRIKLPAIAGLTAMAVTATAFAAYASGRSEPTVPRVSPVVLVDTVAERLFQARCADCHGTQVGHAPLRESLEQRPPETIISALTSGSMRGMASGLTPEQIRSLAVYLSGREPGITPVATATGGMCSTPARPIDPSAAHWNGWGRDLENSRFQPDPGFSAADVPRLRLKWAFSYGEGTVAAQPTIVGDRMYVSSTPGAVYSLDAATGCIRWKYEPARGARTAVVVGQLPNGRHAAYIGATGGFVDALDADTGELLWRTRVEDHPMVSMTGSPVLHEGRLYVPISSSEEAGARAPGYECCTFRGSIVALDAVTGRQIWKSHTITEEPKPIGRNSADVQAFGPAGGAIWMAPTIDTRRGMIYAGTGNAYTNDEDPGSNALIAFDLETGEIRWRTQVMDNDAFVMGCSPQGGHANCPEDLGPDWDFGASPILRTLPDGRQLLLVGQKSGIIWAMDPDRDGEVVWKTKVGGGGPLGGIQWGPAADREFVYVAVSDVFATEGEQRRPGLSAIRIATGEEVWHTPAPPPACAWGNRSCSNGQSAGVSLIPGVVFSGSLDGHLRAYSTRDGSIVWSFDTAAAPYDAVNGIRATGGSIDSGGPTVANGILYTNSGYGRFGYAGNALLAFSVDGR
jgi:polyvinyl alcohol dehydrogenase (cytochrome)